MQIITAKNRNPVDGNVMIVYTEDGDDKTIKSKDLPAVQFSDAWENLALDVKMALASQLGVASAKLDGFLKAHIFQFNKIHYSYKEGEEVPQEYEVFGHHLILDTNWNTDIKLSFNFGDKNSPDKAATQIMEESKRYIGKYRAQPSLFENPEVEDHENN